MLRNLIKRILLPLFIILILIITINTIINGWVIYYESGYNGKVIDAETFEPIEGAVVAAIYDVSVYGFLHSGSAHADVQEALTDSNGEFHISSNIFFYPLPFALGGEGATFIIFKPGYGTYPGNYSFLIYPVKANLRELTSRVLGISTQDMEGIVFEKVMTHKEEWKLYHKKFGGNESPFIPLKNPFEKVRNLDLPFDADVMKAETIWTSSSYRKPFKTYPVIGLPEVKTMEERKKSVRSADSIPPGYQNKVPIWKKMLDREYSFIYKGMH
jgi:hypothetical protein